MRNIFLDTETVGLTGPVVTIQYAYDDGPVVIHEVWKEPRAQTLTLIEDLCEGAAIGWNLPYDWYHIQRCHNVLSLMDTEFPTKQGWLELQKQAINGPCVKPKAGHDVMIASRMGEGQVLMDRKDIRIRRVPERIAEGLCDFLTTNVRLPEIFFLKRQEKFRGWQVAPIEGDDTFVDVVLRFAPSGGLKPTARWLLGVEALDYPMDKSMFPKESMWDLFGDDWKWFLDEHVRFWNQNAIARRYAKDDVVLTRRLWEHFGSPTPGDDNGELATLVGSARWRGWDVDHALLEQIKDEQTKLAEDTPTAPGPVLRVLHKLGADWVTSTNKQVMVTLAELDDEVGAFARRVIAARTAEKRIDVCRKILHTGKAHFDFKVYGTLSGRMAGSSQLNPQGIPKKGLMRKAFTMAGRETPVLCGGDFDSFEVAIAAAVYNDPGLTAALKSGKSFHGLTGADFLELDYDDVVDDNEIYGRSKGGVFAKMYGAQTPKIAEVFGISLEDAERGEERFEARYPGIAREREMIFESFCSMRQLGGLGSKIVWHEPKNYVESLLGFRRSFELENGLCRGLYQIASHLPRLFQGVDKEARVMRRDRYQTILGATSSALYAAAFNIQAQNLRAACNHRIQATGAEITKRLQRRLWDLQPAGIHPWRVQPFQVHDEVLCPQAEDVDTGAVVADVLDEYRGLVPLIAMSWGQNLKDWSER